MVSSGQMRMIYYKGFTEEKITQLDGLLAKVLDNLIQYEKEKK